MRLLGVRNRTRNVSDEWCAGAVFVLLLCLPGCGGGGNNNAEPDDMVSTPTPVVQVTPTPTPRGVRALAVGSVSMATADESGVIARSDETGTLWSVVHRTRSAWNAVEFADLVNGWVVGSNGGILGTSDGGDSWNAQRQDTSEDLRDLAVLSAARVVVVGGAPPVIPAFSGGALVLGTDDRGTSWNRVSVPQGPAIERATLVSVCFLSTGIGVTFGGGTSGGVALRSEDSGQTWLDISDRVAGGDVRASVCVGEQEVWAVGGGPVAFHSADGGQTWEDRSAALRDIFQGQLDAVGFDSAGVGWTAGAAEVGSGSTVSEPILLRTTDAGVTWQRQPLPPLPEPAALTGLALTPLLGVTVGQAEVIADRTFPAGFATEDGGDTWIAIAFPTEIGFLRDVTVVP
jgi:photosystem II stability/assembly factor-like uncharacterized protein